MEIRTFYYKKGLDVSKVPFNFERVAFIAEEETLKASEEIDKSGGFYKSFKRAGVKFPKNLSLFFVCMFARTAAILNHDEKLFGEKEEMVTKINEFLANYSKRQDFTSK